MDMIGKVRRMHRRDNKSVREIARLTGLSRNTVAKWLEAPLEGRPQYRRGPQPSKPLVTGRQVVAVEDTQPPAGQAGRWLHGLHHRGQALGAALDQAAQNRRLGA